MGSQTQSDRGQSVIEATLVIPLILLIFSLGIAYVFSIKEKFKHDYLAGNLSPPVPQAPGAEAPAAIDLELSKKLLSLPGGSVRHNLGELQDNGWQIKNQVKTAKKILYLLTRGNEHLLFDGHLGVITCGSDCSNP